MTKISLTMKSWETYNPSKSLVWNTIHMPKCSKCNKRYGTEVWNDDENIREKKVLANAPKKVNRYGLYCYYCPDCYSQLKR